MTPVLAGIKVQLDPQDRRVKQVHKDNLDQVDHRDLKVTEDLKEQQGPRVRPEHQGYQVQSVSQALLDHLALQVALALRALKDRLAPRDRLGRLGPLDQLGRQEAKDSLEIEDYLVTEDNLEIVEFKDRLVKLGRRECKGHRGHLEPRERLGQLEIKGPLEKQDLRVVKVPPDLLDQQVLLETSVLLVKQEHLEAKARLDLKVL